MKLLISIVLSLVLPAISLRAQAFCTGAACPSLAATDRFNQLYFGLQSQYLPEVARDMSEAAILAGAAGIPLGTVNLRRFTVGVSGSAALVPPRLVKVTLPETHVDRLPTTGASILPRFFVGINLGALTGFSFDPYSRKSYSEQYDEKYPPEESAGERPVLKTPPWYSPARFDLFLSGARAAGRHVSRRPAMYVDYDSQLAGADLHYHLVEGNNILFGSMLRFRGAQLGLGYYRITQHLSMQQDKTRLDLLGKDTIYTWHGSTTIRMDNSIHSMPLELRTGIQLLYLFNLGVGAGVAFSQGESNIELFRTAPLVSVEDERAFIPYSQPRDARGKVMNSLSAYATTRYLMQETGGDDLPQLSMLVQARGRIPSAVPYVRLAAELNLAALKLSLETLYSVRSTATTVGARMEF
ncbi:MAG: hypothetical protein HS115_17985 [Spirochaetales bacterium]|nr:hypothetical protein [Spirochaetales bacterium]